MCERVVCVCQGMDRQCKNQAQPGKMYATHQYTYNSHNHALSPGECSLCIASALRQSFTPFGRTGGERDWILDWNESEMQPVARRNHRRQGGQGRHNSGTDHALHGRNF